jgi:adenylate cyclase
MPLEPLYTMIFADACLNLGHADEGLRATDDAMAMMRASGVRVWESEFHRLRGELLLVRAPTDTGAAEACFREALAIARRQGAQGWELRAATSLGRLLGRHARRAEARQALADAYGRFTEGFDSATLKDARALLAELS